MRKSATLRCARCNMNDEEAEAHVYLAETKRILDWDLDGAEAEFKRALRSSPNSTTSNYFIAASLRRARRAGEGP